MAQNFSYRHDSKGAVFSPGARTWWQQRIRCSQLGLHIGQQFVSILLCSLCTPPYWIHMYKSQKLSITKIRPTSQDKRQCVHDNRTRSLHAFLQLSEQKEILLERWSLRFSMGPLPVTMACTKNPNMENMARRPFLISFTRSSAKLSGSSARPRGSNASPGYRGSRPAQRTPHQQQRPRDPCVMSYESAERCTTGPTAV